MSRKNRNNGGGVKSPIQMYFKFDKTIGSFVTWDKENKEEVFYDELNIIPIDIRKSVSGFSERHKGQLYSNKVESINTDELSVFISKNGKSKLLFQGLYKDIKDKLKDLNGKFTINVLALVKIKKDWVLSDISLTGSSVSNWFDFESEYPRQTFYDYEILMSRGALSKREEGKIVPVTKEEEKKLEEALKKNPRKKRPVWFYVIDIKALDVLGDKELELADSADDMLSEYFESNSSGSSSGSEPTTESEVIDDVEDDDLPF